MIYNDKWLEMFLYAKKYYEVYGNLEIPQGYTFRTRNGENIALGAWLKRQKYYYKVNKLTIEQTKKLESIGIIWKSIMSGTKKNVLKKSSEWLKYYKEVLNYFNTHGNSILREEDVALDENGETLEIGLWLKVQAFRYLKGDLTKEQTELLEQVGIKRYMNIFEKVLK